MKRLSCKDASELISRQHEHVLTAGEKFWLRLHLFICAGCRNFQNNLKLIRGAFNHYLNRGDDR